ncbi:MAG: DUF2508 family protein [Ignavibacteriales bacterium]
MRLLDMIWNAFQDAFVLDQGQKRFEKWEDCSVLEAAKKDWQTAQSIFDEVNDPELIDFAVYNLKAAEKKYTYLLKRLRDQEEGPPVVEYNM